MTTNTMPKAEQISFKPAGSITSTDIQSAIEELNGQAAGAVGKYLPVSVSTTPFQSTSFNIVSVDATSGNKVVLTPQTPEEGDLLIVRKTDSSANTVVVSGPGFTLQNQFESVEFYFDGTSWNPTNTRKASDISITDSSNLFSGSNVEAALTQVGQYIFRSYSQESYVALAGQTTFNLLNSYTVNTNSLQVFRNGLRQLVGIDYVEFSSSQIQFIAPCESGDTILLNVGFVTNTGTTPNISFLDESQTLTAGQTVITLQNAYNIGVNNVSLYLNGVRLIRTNDYVESSSTTLTLNQPAEETDTAYIQIGQLVNGTNPTTSDQIQHTPVGPTPATISIRTALNDAAGMQVRFVQDKAAGDTLASSLPDGATVIVTADESQGGVRVRYTVAAGVLGSAVLDTSEMVQFTPAGTGAVARTAQDKMREVVSVKDFGAVGDGVTDDTAAIQAAINYATSVRRQLPGIVVGFSSPEVHFTEGLIYLTTGNITVGAGIRLVGNKCIITSSTGFPYATVNSLFIGVQQDCVIDGFITFGFIDIVQIATGNVDTALIEIKNCEIQEWSGTAINVDNNSASTLLKIHNNKFCARLASAIVLKNQCDVCLFDSNWVTGPCDLFFWNFKALYIRGLVGVPFASTSGSRWILNQGTALTCVDSRFGGEFGARTIVDNFVGPGGTNATKLVINNCEVYTTGFPVIRFNDIPDVFVFTENYGLTGSLPFQFNAVPTATRNGLGSRNTWVVDRNQQVLLGGIRSNSEDTGAAIKANLVQNVNAKLSTETLLAASIVRNILYTESGFSPAGSLGAGMGSAVITDLFGAAQQRIDGVNGDSNFNTSWQTLMTGLSAGVYTMLINLEVTNGSSVLVILNACNNVRSENLTVGNYTLTVPFYFDGTNAPNCGYVFRNLCTGTSIAHGGLRIVYGMADGYNKWNSEVYGDSAPASGYWRFSDRVINKLPAVGMPKAWVCTAAGSPGTWVSEGNL